ncbi:MAG: hypothetical protein KME54_28910 [Tolypothrix brevis GSE-NOS-MK-07-07A]|jgi:hypothetical protein|nr:hypothetical protein [Tolypothrix brevis GSE-NOS-MK-07-07A]
MGTRETAYLKYLSGENSNLTENQINPDDIPQFQRMAAIATQQGGNLNYADYPANEDNTQFRQTVGRTGEGGISREGNTYVIKDRYDFNSKTASPIDRLKVIASSIGSGDPLAALSHSSTFVGNEFDTNARVPVPLNQQKAPAYSPENTVIGGQQYRWEASLAQPGEGYEDVAKTAFAGNKYAPDGSNLARYAQMIIKQNQGNTSNIIYKPVPVNQSDNQEQPNQLASLFGSVASGVSSGLSSLFGQKS